MINTFLFDFDGTLIDTAPDLINTANEIYLKYNHKEISFQEGLGCSSNGINAFLKKRFTPDEINNNSLFDEFVEIYKNNCYLNASLFPGFLDILKDLRKRGFKIGIVTNKPRIFTDLILNHLGINSMFDIVLCPDDGFKPKPDNQMFLEVFDKLNVAIVRLFMLVMVRGILLQPMHLILFLYLLVMATSTHQKILRYGVMIF